MNKELTIATINLKRIIVDNVLNVKYLYVQHNIKFKAALPADQLLLKKGLYKTKTEILENSAQIKLLLLKKYISKE
jgi:hypothetical protein